MAASSFGWYVYPPIGFQVLFDGVGAIWNYEGTDAWYPLQSAQFPGLATQFDAVAPDDVKGFCPPFLTMTEDPGILQIWTGLVARTPAGWSLLLRAPANLPHSPGYQHLEGIVETDRWGGPLFFNVRLVHTGIPLQFAAHRPFLQVQPVHRAYYDDAFLNGVVVQTGVASLSDDDWQVYRQTVVIPNSCPHRTLGAYAVAARKRRAEERR